MSVKTEKELAQAIEDSDETIEIEGDLVKKTVKIKATGKIAWLVAIGAIGVAVAIIVVSGGTGAPASAVVGIGAVSVLGLPTAISAVAIAVAARGVGVLNKLRKYKIVEKSSNKIVLKKK